MTTKSLLLSKLILFIIIFTITASCLNKKKEQIPTEAIIYLNEVLSILEEHSIKKNEINWDDFKQKIYKAAENCKSIEDTYVIIKNAISELGDNHSYFVNKPDAVSYMEETLPPELQDEKVPEGIAYIRIPYCIGNEVENEKYISSVTEKIREQSRQQIKAWIIDLRDNFGGNMWPMISAAGPFLPEGVQGYFIHADQQKSTWIYVEGKAILDSVVLAENPEQLSLNLHDKKIAILTNAKTASSGEAMAVVFKGLPNTQSFGEKTYGVSTGCNAFELSDGSRINLAISVFADRNLVKYGASIIPDVECESEIALQKAIEWINTGTKK